MHHDVFVSGGAMILRVLFPVSLLLIVHFNAAHKTVDSHNIYCFVTKETIWLLKRVLY